MSALPSAITAEWTPPSNFDVAAELHAQTGRLVKALAFMLAAAALSLSIGPVHEAVAAFDVQRHLLIYVALFSFGVSWLIASMKIICALRPPFTQEAASAQEWDALFANRWKNGAQAGAYLYSCFTALVGVWMGVLLEGTIFWWFSMMIDLTCLVAFTVAVNGNAAKVVARLTDWLPGHEQL